MVKRGLLSCVAALTGCDFLTSSFRTNEFSGDPYPILVDQSSGAILVGMQREGEDLQNQAVLDVMSPLTVIDPGSGVQPQIDFSSFTLLGARTPGGELTLPRAQFIDHQIVTLHPCNEGQTCSVGPGDAPRSFNALIGLDTFGGDALRLRLASDEIFVLPDIAGSAVRRARACDAVMESPFRGGGTLVLGGTEITFTNWRIAIDACIRPRPARQRAQSGRGTDALFVLSTAIGPSVMTQTAYERYSQLADATLSIPALDTLPVHTVLLPSGPVTGNLGSIPSIALVSNSGSNPRAPCRQMWASHLLALRDCLAGDDCPCDTTMGETFCAAPAVVELQPADPGLAVLIVPDTEPTIQALRTELRPDRPEVDGILGTEAMQALELDIDYVHDRLLARCIDRATCGARPALADKPARSYVNGCLGDQPGPIMFSEGD
jgi:hypothetical protein